MLSYSYRNLRRAGVFMYNHQLETFIRVADAGSFNKAAEESYITPTAIIKQINLLEDSLGVKLFERTRRGLTLTKAGRSMYQDAKYIIQYCHDSVIRARNAMQEDSNVIRIGSSPMTPAQLLMELWSKVQTICPDIKFQIVPFENTPENAREILADLGTNIDVVGGIFDETMLHLRKCAGLELVRRPFYCAVSIHHKLAAKDRLQVARAEIAAPKQDGVQRLVDIEQKMAEGKGRGYERWAKIHNLKQAAKTLSVYQQYGFTSPEQLEAAVDTAYQKMRQTSGELKALETKLQGKKKLQRQVLAYAQTKAARDGLRAQKSEKARAAYRQAHESDFIIADAAARYFKAHGITKLPARKALQAEIEQLISEKDGLYNTYHEQKQRFKELQTVKRNIDQILRRDEPHRRKEQSHER